MKKLHTLLIAVGFVMSTLQGASAAEIIFDPGVQWYDMNGDGQLSLWGVPEAGGNPLKANPKDGWPTPVAVAAWYAALLKAQQMGKTVGVGYDPATFIIWYVGRPR